MCQIDHLWLTNSVEVIQLGPRRAYDYVPTNKVLAWLQEVAQTPYQDLYRWSVECVIAVWPVI